MSGKIDNYTYTIMPMIVLSCRYILTQYLVVIWAVNGIRAKKMDDDAVPQDIKDFIIAILVIAVLTFVVRVVLVIYKCIRKPLNKMTTVTDIST